MKIVIDDRDLKTLQTKFAAATQFLWAARLRQEVMELARIPQRNKWQENRLCELLTLDLTEFHGEWFAEEIEGVLF